MTAAVQLGIQRIEAMTALNREMREIADLIGVTPVDMPVHSKHGAEYLVVRQLEAMGQWATAIKAAVTPAVITATPAEESIDPTPHKRGRKKAE